MFINILPNPDKPEIPARHRKAQARQAGEAQNSKFETLAQTVSTD